MFFFGLVMICQGLGMLHYTFSDTGETNVELVSLVTNYSGLLAARFFLGLAESGTFPGCTCAGSLKRLVAGSKSADKIHVAGFYLISMWYKRIEAQRRFSFFFGSTTLAGAFGSLLASAIGKMNGMRGYRAWRWIFILEGVLTCVIAVVTYFLITDFPEDAKWLDEDEKAFVKARLKTDQGMSELEQRITLRDVGQVAGDYKTWLGTFMYFGLIVPAYVSTSSFHSLGLLYMIVRRVAHLIKPRVLPISAPQ